MIENRSVPPNTILPHVEYQDLDAAIAWLTKTFDFSEHYRYGQPTSGAQLYLGNAWVMVRQAREGQASPAKLGFGTQSLTVFVDDVEAHFRRAEAAGAKLVEELHETAYGELQYGALDLDGHHWLFSRHAHDVNPSDWGARVAKCASRLALLRRPRLCYWEVPSGDVNQSANFYERVFGWNIRHRGTPRPRFDDATGDVSGAFVAGRSAAGEAGLLPYIWVDDIDATMARAVEQGGAVVEPVRCEDRAGRLWIAAFRDPAGNRIGLYQEGPASGVDHRP